MSEDAGILRCEGCGYQLVGIATDASGLARCPECGETSDAQGPGRLRPWPPLASVGWRLCGPLALNVAAVLGMTVAIWALGVDNVPRRPFAAAFIILLVLLPVTGVIHPGLAAILLAERHAPRRVRTRTAAAVLGAALGMNLAVFGAAVAVAWWLDAW